MTRPETMETRAGTWGLYWEITRGHRKLFAWGALALLGVDLLELIPPLALGTLIDVVSKGGSGWFPMGIAAGYIGVFILQSVIRYPMRMGLIGASTRAVTSLRERYARHLLRVRRSSLAGRSAGDLMNRAIGDLGAVEGALSSGLLFFFDCTFYLLTIPVVMLLISPRLCLVAFLALPVVPLIAQLLVRRITQASEDVQESFGRLASRAHENVSAIQTIRAFGLEEREERLFESASAEVVAKDLGRSRLEVLFSGSVQLLIAVGVFAVLLLGGRQAIEHHLTLGQFVTFLQYMGMMAWPLTGLAWAFLLFRKGEVGLRRIQEILNLPAADRDGGGPISRPQGALEIRNLTFSHPGSPTAALSDLSFKIQAGERVALLGPTGAGKSTLVDLITRMVDPPGGTVFVDGLDVRLLDMRDLRRCVAVASPEAFLFSETIRENIALGLDEKDRVCIAAATAQVSGEDFASGLETVVGEKGASLSGGQRQRVALARAFARKASLLILDDACSALDAETEEKVFLALSREAGDATVLFSTHRVRRAREADRIIVLEQGRVVEQGIHEELWAADGVYAGWVRRQALSDEFDRS